MNQDALSAAGNHTYQSGGSSGTDKHLSQVAGYENSTTSRDLSTQMSKATISNTMASTHPPHISQPPAGTSCTEPAQSTPNTTTYPSATTGDGYGNGLNATPTSGPGSGSTGAGGGEYKAALPHGQPKRLHVSNIPFRFREPDLRQLFYVSTCDARGLDWGVGLPLESQTCTAVSCGGPIWAILGKC